MSLWGRTPGAGHVPTDLGTEVDRLQRHYIQASRDLAKVCARAHAGTVDVVKPFRARINIQRPVDMNDSHSVRSDLFAERRDDWRDRDSSRRCEA